VRLPVLCVAAAVAVSARDVQVRIDANRVIALPLENYVAAALSGEASTFSSNEALRAMAVTARSFALRHLGRHRTEGFDLCGATHCQKLQLAVNNRPDLRAVAESTENEVLWYEGRPIAAHHHAHCGGTTAAASEIWPGLRAPYLRSLTDTFCLMRGRAEWSTELEGEVKILRRSPSGRVSEISVNGERMPAERRLRSNLFAARTAGGKARVAGYGSGHGVGLCQTGADERGKAGHLYADILAFYFPGTTLGISASGLRWQRASGERVDAFATDAATAREIAAAGDAALRKAEAITGWSVRDRPQLRTYPSLPVYRDATGSGGSIAATSVGLLIRMQPAGLLRSRGVLHSTLLHEMLHVAIDVNAGPGLPPWYSEGLALFLSGTNPPARTRHAAALAKIRKLAQRHNRATLLGWVQSGLPAAAIPPRTPPATRRPKDTQ
jgi:stage II sporulation protein D